MINPLRPYSARMCGLMGLQRAEFAQGAVETWQEAPGDSRRVRPALYLPGQIERIRAAMFASLTETIGIMQFDGEASDGPTIGRRYRDVDLVDGVLYRPGAELHLRNRQRRFGLAFRPRRAISGALFETWITNRWFGSWLMNALPAWYLAQKHGPALTTATAPAPGSHTARYQQLLGIEPQYLNGDVHFDELVLFDDLPDNAAKRRRQCTIRERLCAGLPMDPGPGVFLLRGRGGDLRFLENEDALAGRLARDRGFLVIDPMQVSVDELIAACAAAPVIVGVEGSHLVHGLLVARPGAGILPIQPPDRVAGTLKGLCDRLDQRYGLVVGEGNDSVFTLDWRDLAATLDLFERDHPTG